MCIHSQFSHELVGERILKIGPHLPKLLSNIKGYTFLGTQCIMTELVAAYDEPEVYARYCCTVVRANCTNRTYRHESDPVRISKTKTVATQRPSTNERGDGISACCTAGSITA